MNYGSDKIQTPRELTPVTRTDGTTQIHVTLDQLLSTVQRQQIQIDKLLTQIELARSALTKELTTQKQELMDQLTEGEAKLNQLNADLNKERTGWQRKTKNAAWFISGSMVGGTISAMLTTFALLKLGTKHGWIQGCPADSIKPNN